MSTPRQLQRAGAKFIKRQSWTQGRVYLADDFWGFVHPEDVPAKNPMPVRIDTMLPGDDWIEVEELKKVSKASVHYREAKGSHRCGNCAMLHGNTCDLVVGRIEKTYVCDKWVAKK